MDKQPSNFDRLVRLALIAALTYWSLWLIMPAFGVLAWGFILAVALYPIYLWFYKHLGKRSSSIAAILVTFLSLLIIVGSLVSMTNNMVSTVSDFSKAANASEQSIIPQPPEGVKNWPLIGDQLYQGWSLASTNTAMLIKRYSSFLIDLGKFLLDKTASFSFDLLLFIISVLFAGYLLSKSDGLIKSLNKLAERISPERGVTLINIVKNTIQSVARGVIGLSFIQALAIGLILLMVGIPAAGLISFIALLMGIAQLGLFLLVIPLMVWLFFILNFLPALVLSILLVLIAVSDSFLKPIILARGLQTPTLVIFLGVIGGVLTHGVIGIFIGPIILAVFYDLVDGWLNQQ